MLNRPAGNRQAPTATGNCQAPTGNIQPPATAGQPPAKRQPPTANRQPQAPTASNPANRQPPTANRPTVNPGQPPTANRRVTNGAGGGINEYMHLEPKQSSAGRSRRGAGEELSYRANLARRPKRPKRPLRPGYGGGGGFPRRAAPVPQTAASFLRPGIRVTLSFLLLLAGMGAAAQTQQHSSQEHRFQLVTVAAGLHHPWALAFLPGGDLLVTERRGRLLRITADGGTREIGGLPEVTATGQGGLLDLVLDPDFADNRLLYFSYSEQVGGRLRTAVARAELAGDRLAGLERIFAMNRASSAGRHFGSRLAFLPDGDLLVTIGDRGQRDRAQDPSDHAGSVLRIRPDGSPSPRTTALAIPGAAPEVFTFGHRNAQGLAIHPATGAIWVHEHGPRGGDEINVLRGGANYGWPLATHGREYWGGRIASSEAPGTEQPLLHWTPSIAPSGMAFYTGTEFPRWNGDLFVGALAGRHLRRVVLRGGAVVDQEVLLEGRPGRIRDVRQGPDGRLWLLTDERRGGLYRLDPAAP